ncbi:MAG: phage holin family protein [Burkholderiales bacterium]|nr:phage holin family protein [Burkholderiales bacterium]
MALTDSLRQFAATLINISHTRLELASVELEEEIARFSSMLLWSLTALFFAGLAVLLAIALLVALFWDTHKIALLCALLTVFSGTAIVIAMRMRKLWQEKPRLLSFTLTELKKDSAALQGESATPPSE